MVDFSADAHVFKRILTHHCKWEGDWILSRKQRIFYTMKALICFYALRWKNQRRWDVNDFSMYPPDPVEVAILDGGISYSMEYTIHWAVVLQVGKGLFSEWWAREEYVSD